MSVRWIKRTLLAGAMIAVAGTAKAACPLPTPESNAYPFVSGCPLPAANLNAAFAARATLVGPQTLIGTTVNCADNVCTVRLGFDVTGTLPIANGGTGGTTVPGARSALGFGPAVSIQAYPGADPTGATSSDAAYVSCTNSGFNCYIPSVPAGGFYEIACADHTATAGITVFGDSWETSILKLPSGCTRGTQPLIRHANFRSLTINVNGATAAANTTILGVSNNANTSPVVEDVHIIGFTDRMFPVVVGGISSNTTNVSIRNNYFAMTTPTTEDTRCVLFTHAGGGMIVSGWVTDNTCVNVGGLGGNASHVTVSRNHISGWKYSAAIFFGQDADTHHNDISDNDLFDSPTGVDVDNTPHLGIENWGYATTIAVNRCSNLGGICLDQGGKRGQVTVNSAIGVNKNNNVGLGAFNSRYADATYNASDSFFGGNKSQDDGGGTQYYGYSEQAGGLTGIVVAANDFDGNATGPVNKAADSNTSILQFGAGGLGGLTATSVGTAICTTSNGSAVVTGCNSTLGMAVGNFVTGPGIAASATIASGLTASGFTMSANAGAGAGAGLVNARASFWSDVDGGAPSIIRMPGRLMIGNAIGQAASRLVGTSYDFCPTSTYCASWAARDADLAVMSQVGGQAIVGMSKVSLGQSISPAVASIGGAFFSINDGSINLPAWAIYGDVQFDNTVAGTKTWVAELVGKNRSGRNGISTPYSEAEGVTGIALRAGGDGSYGGQPTNPANTGIWIGKGTGNAGNYTNYSWNKGIAFDAKAVTGTDGVTGTGTAIELARGHVIAWKGPSSITGANLYSTVDASSQDVTLKFQNNIIGLMGTGETQIANFVHTASAVNRFDFSNGATGVAPKWACAGSDTDIDCQVSPKGAGVFRINSGIKINTKLLVSPTAPTIASGGCTTGSAQSVSGSNGSAAFEITLGGATCGSTIVLTLPAANAKWVCDAHNNTNSAGNSLDSVGTSTTSVTLTNYVRTTGVAGNFTGADVLAVKCLPY